MTQEQIKLADTIKEKMKLLQFVDDIEIEHKKADALLCEMLNALGCEDIVKEYNDVAKWYA